MKPERLAEIKAAMTTPIGSFVGYADCKRQWVVNEERWYGGDQWLR